MHRVRGHYKVNHTKNYHNIMATDIEATNHKFDSAYESYSLSRHNSIPVSNRHSYRRRNSSGGDYSSFGRRDSVSGFQKSPIGSPDLNFSETGSVVKHRHRNQELRRSCDVNDVCSQCPLAERCMDRPLQEDGLLDKTELNEVFEWQKDWVELLRANIALNVSKTKHRINETFDNLIQVLEKRRKELLRKTDIEGKKKLSLLKFNNEKLLQMQDEYDVIEEVPKLPVAKQQPIKMTDDPVNGQKTTIASIKGLRVLRVGNLHFSYENEIVDSFSKFGEIGENLASAIHSEAVGLGLYYGLVNEDVTFRIITRNAKMQNSFIQDDTIKVQVRGPANTVRTAEVKTGENATHTASFKPTQPGCHDFHIYVNNLELPESPFCCHVYEKEKLTFDQEPIVAYGSHLDAQGQGAWTVQKDGKSALLTKSSSSGAIIHASQQFSDHKHAWKVKFTSACPMVRICLGASSKTNIFDVDIEHTCDFNLGITKYGPKAERRTSRSKRRSSIYKRESRTYMVLLDLKNKRLTIVCCETEEGKHLTLPDQSDSLYPCVFMTHECKNEACPRPVVTFY